MGVVLSAFEAEALLAGWIGVGSGSLRDGEGLGGRIEDLVAWSLGCAGASAISVPGPTPRQPELGPTLAIGWEESPAGPAARARASISDNGSSRPPHSGSSRWLRTAQHPDDIGSRGEPPIRPGMSISPARRRPSSRPFDEQAGDASRAVAGAQDAAPDGAPGLAAALGALLAHLAARPVFARVAFCELPSVGPVGLQRRDFALEALGDCLGPCASAVAREATAAAIRRRTACGVEPSLTALVLATWIAQHHPRRPAPPTGSGRH